METKLTPPHASLQCSRPALRMNSYPELYREIISTYLLGSSWRGLAKHCLYMQLATPYSLGNASSPGNASIHTISPDQVTRYTGDPTLPPTTMGHTGNTGK